MGVESSIPIDVVSVKIDTAKINGLSHKIRIIANSVFARLRTDKDLTFTIYRYSRKDDSVISKSYTIKKDVTYFVKTLPLRFNGHIIQIRIHGNVGSVFELESFGFNYDVQPLGLREQ